MNAACRPNDAQTVPRRRKIQPSARATGMREREADHREPERLAGVRPGDGQDVREGEDQRGQDEPSPVPESADPRRGREGPEQDLLAERCNDDPGQQRQREPGGVRRSVAGG